MVSWGILGTAQIALDKVAPAILATPGARLAGLASRSGDKAAEWLEKMRQQSGQELADTKVYTSYAALLDDPAIDAVYIPLPNSLHCEWTIKAAQAKKHVLCEKPLACSAEEARLMIDTCRQAGVLLMEGFMYQFSPQYDRVRELLAQDRIGEPMLLKAAFSYMLDNRNDIRYSRALGGGSLMDVGCYCIHGVRTLFGEEPISVSAYERHDEHIDTSYLGILAFPGGKMALIDASFSMTARQSIEIVGTKGVILIDQPFIADTKPTVLTIGPTLGFSDTSSFTKEVIPAASTYQLEIAAFSQAVAECKVLPIDPEDGYRNMRVIRAVAEAARTKRTVQLVGS
ncbi:MAG: Gfo/Idh/MocA family oxidoreductase [Firmicutes bacterium]|nr:Gfo/Idh/MocA family oxidoreductase [Bacillota bacterium]